MKKWALALVLLLAIPTWGEKKYKIVTDSPEDKRLMEIEGEPDTKKRLAMLEEFAQKFAGSEALPYTYQMYSAAYLELKQYDKAVEYGEMAADADDEDLDALITLVRAALETKDYARVHKWSVAAVPLHTKAKADPMEDLDDEDFDAEHAKLKSYLEFLEYSLFQAAAQDTTPERVKYLDSFAQSFPESEQIKQLPALYAVTYQRLGDVPKMLESAEKAIETEPENESMLLLLAETRTHQLMAQTEGRKPEEVEEVQQLGERLLEVVQTKSAPEGVAEADWEHHLNNFRGAGHSIMGRVLMMQEKIEDALKELEAAAPLLEGNVQALSPVLFFQGWGYAKLIRNEEARTVLERCVEMGGAYAQAAGGILKKLPPPKRKRRR